MEYNNEFLEQFIAYIEVTYSSVETLATDILSKKIQARQDVEEKVTKTLEDFVNIIKFMEFCKANDTFFTHNTENSVQVLNGTMVAYKEENLVLLYDYLYYGVSNELMEMFKAVDMKLAE